MNLTIKRPSESLFLPAAVLGLYLAIGCFYLKDYLLWDSQWLLALVLVPLVAQVQPVKSLSTGLLLAATALALLAAGLQNSTLYFFAFLAALWCGAELLLGRISLYPLLLLAVASPIFKYVANIISFPLRLQLTSWAVALLKAIGTDAAAAGNIILVNGEDFPVDPACAGLSMLSLSLILAVFVLAHLQRKQQLHWPLWLTGMLLGLMLLLNLGANLVRILLLVLFKVLPQNPMHDLVGLLCLLMYVLLPFCLLASKLLPRFGKSPGAKPASTSVSLRGALFLNYLLLLLLAGIGASVEWQKPAVAEKQAPTMPGFAAEQMENGITKYSNAAALVYLKPVPAFYATEHHPLICWEGSGYAFRRVQQRQLGSYRVYCGELRKGQVKLYTAWWMDNGRHRTIDQWDWRWRMLKGEAGFRLVNVTVARQEQLAPAIQRIMAQGWASAR